MKAAAFEYLKARSLEEVCEILAAPADGAERKIIAGGQTLVPLMAMRLARPELLVDINDIEALQTVTAAGEAVVTGAGARQRTVELSTDAARAAPLLVKALGFVGHQQTRNRGTIGGSLVHGDPSAEIPLVALVLDARLRARSAGGMRTHAASTFFRGPMMTALDADECLVDVRFPIWGGTRIGASFQEVASRHGDFAIVSACAQVQLDAAGRCVRIAAGVGGAAPTPVRPVGLERALLGGTLDAAAVAAALHHIEEVLEPDTDLHASADYRRRVAGVLLGRAIAQARAAAAA